MNGPFQTHCQLPPWMECLSVVCTPSPVLSLASVSIVLDKQLPDHTDMRFIFFLTCNGIDLYLTNRKSAFFTLCVFYLIILLNPYLIKI